jgi:hypothetical protein
MSKELDDVTHALAEFLTVVGRTTKDEAAERAIIRVADSVVMVLGGIERRPDLLELDRKAKLH